MYSAKTKLTNPVFLRKKIDYLVLYIPLRCLAHAHFSHIEIRFQEFYISYLI